MEENAPLDNLELQKGFYLLFTDGGIVAESKGQASGEASIGIVLKDPRNRTEVERISKRIGHKINHHVAEYEALIAGLELANQKGIKYLGVFSDSQLVVNQVNRTWNNKTEHLQELCKKAQALASGFKGIQISWVPREWNKGHEPADEALKGLR